jgi:tetraacyldisaccharide 4'-kinase
MKYLRLLLFPFSLIYGLVIIMRNWFYDAGLLVSREFDVPVIAVGNLDVGGAGKSPMTEYLIRLLKSEHKLATLSRAMAAPQRGFLLPVKTLLLPKLVMNRRSLNISSRKLRWRYARNG